MRSYDNNFSTNSAWVIFEHGLPLLYSSDGMTQISKIMSLTTELDANNYPVTTAKFIVNVGTRQEMEAFVSAEEGLTKTQAQAYIDKLRANGYLPINPQP